jgi:serine/threonine protein kinase
VSERGDAATRACTGASTYGRVRQIALDVLGGLGAAHALGVVHRDIKPSNLLVADDGSIKVADFGIAKSVASSDHTATGDVVGSVAYVAPERFEGGDATAGSDLYSLGVVLYEAVTGHKPFSGGSPAAVAHAIVTFSAPPVDEANPHVDPDLGAAIDRALAKRTADRFASAAEMAGALRRPELDPTLLVPTCRLADPHPQVAATRSDLPGTTARIAATRESKSIGGGSPQPEATKRRRRPVLVGSLVLAILSIGTFAWLAARHEGSAKNPVVATSPSPTASGAPTPTPAPLPEPLEDALRRLEQSVRQ